MELGIKLPEWLPPVTEMSSEEYEKARCAAMNAEAGGLPGEHCDVCNDKGLVYYLKGSEIVCRPCECMVARENLERVHRSGLAGTLDAYTFDSFIVNEPWQGKAKEKVLDYAKNPSGWLLVCGQVGSGKTHLCTAAVGELMKTGMSARYMLWRDEVVKLKSCVNDEREYDRLIRPLKKVDILYVDDLFKTASGATPTQGDVNVAFELINYRYCRNDSITIFSCEMTVDEILRVDEAVGSRIFHRAKDHNVFISRDESRNYRLKG